MTAGINQDLFGNSALTELSEAIQPASPNPTMPPMPPITELLEAIQPASPNLPMAPMPPITKLSEAIQPASPNPPMAIMPPITKLVSEAIQPASRNPPMALMAPITELVSEAIQPASLNPFFPLPIISTPQAPLPQRCSIYVVREDLLQPCPISREEVHTPAQSVQALNSQTRRLWSLAFTTFTPVIITHTESVRRN